MNQIEVAEMVGAFHWSPDVLGVIEDETAVQLVMEHTGVTRQKAMRLLLEHSPSRRARRQRTVTRVAGLYIAGAIDRDAAMQTLLDETGMSLGWCAAALADAVEEPHRDERGRWTP